ncbi:MAG: peptidase M20, partial [Sphingobium sp.]|nr:peptidase M20 [Sphingobium sp.]
MRHTLAALLAVASFTSAAAAQTEPASTAVPAQATPPAQSEIGAAVAKDMDAMMALYRDLHANPELSLKEVNTAAKLAKRLKALKYDVTEKVGGTGVVAVMKNGTGP